ncbi:MAG: hypothetical protein ABSE42_01715 [Bryobacteraceae bacterium]
MPRMLWMVLVVWIAAGQTQIDMTTQVKNVPIKAGASLPSTCAVGQIFFLTNAPTGANLYGCTAVNTWSAQGGQPGTGAIMQGTLAGMPTTCTVGQTYFATDASAGANLYGCSAANAWTPEGGGTETIGSNGVTVGSRPTTNFLTGAGLISVITDTGTEINIQSALDTAVVATLPSEQIGYSLLCDSASGSATTYACSMTPTATEYAVGMVLHWIPDVNGAGGATTLNVDTLGATSIKQADGVSDPSATDIVAGSMREVWYDGLDFRFLGAGPAPTSGSGSAPVQSVFGRTGTVAAANGDYTASQVTNAAATNSSNTFTAGTQDFSGAAHTSPAIVVSSSGNLPAACATGELAFVSGAAAGQQIYECSAANVWTQQSGGGTGGSSGTSYGTIDLSTASSQASGIIIPGVWNLGANAAGTYYSIGGINLPNTGSPAITTFPMRLPYDLDITQPVSYVVDATTACCGGEGNNAQFTLAVSCIASGYNYSSPPVFGTPLPTGVFTIWWGSLTETSAISGVDMATSSCIAGELAFWQLTRDNTITGNLADNAGLLDVSVKYVRKAN